MALASISPFFFPFSAPSPHSFKVSPTTSSSLFIFLTRNLSPRSSYSSTSIAHHLRANPMKRDGVSTESSASSCLDEESLRNVAGAKDADQAMDIIVEAQGRVWGGEVGNGDCRLSIAAAIDRGNVELALLVFHAMRSGFEQGLSEKISSVERWSWARPDVRTGTLLVQGLAASLRVSDAIRIITYVSQVGVSSGEEGTSCSKCRHQYQLVSGDIVSIDSVVISMDNSAWEMALRLLQIMEWSTPAALHSIVVRTPSGTVSTHKFATKTAELAAQEGERVTISLAGPSNVYRKKGPLKLSAKAPGLSLAEPMYLTNHTSGQVSQLLRAPVKDGSSLFNSYILFSALTLLATGDAASGFIDLSLPRLISVVVVASVALGLL